jgi:hypothetical protein
MAHLHTSDLPDEVGWRELMKVGSAFLIADFYGVAAEAKFRVSMMNDETGIEDGATVAAFADFKTFNNTYLPPDAEGRGA